MAKKQQRLNAVGKFDKKKGGKFNKQEDENAEQNTLDELCKILKFRSKTPKVIDLTDDVRMPSTLLEKAIRCTKEEKDLYMYYYLS